jgi:hypothetical protein
VVPVVKVERGWMGYPAVFVNKVFYLKKYRDFPIYKILVAVKNEYCYYC